MKTIIAALSAPLIILGAGTAAAAGPAGTVTRPYTVTVQQRGHVKTTYKCQRSPVHSTWRRANCLPQLRPIRNPHLTTAVEPANTCDHGTCRHTKTFEIPHASGCDVTVTTVLRGTVYDVRLAYSDNSCRRFIRGQMQCNYFLFHTVVESNRSNARHDLLFMGCPHGALTSLQDIGIQWKRRSAGIWSRRLVLVHSYGI